MVDSSAPSASTGGPQLMHSSHTTINSNQGFSYTQSFIDIEEIIVPVASGASAATIAWDRSLTSLFGARLNMANLFQTYKLNWIKVQVGQPIRGQGEFGPYLLAVAPYSRDEAYGPGGLSQGIQAIDLPGCTSRLVYPQSYEIHNTNGQLVSIADNNTLGEWALLTCTNDNPMYSVETVGAQNATSSGVFYGNGALSLQSREGVDATVWRCFLIEIKYPQARTTAITHHMPIVVTANLTFDGIKWDQYVLYRGPTSRSDPLGNHSHGEIESGALGYRGPEEDEPGEVHTMQRSRHSRKYKPRAPLSFTGVLLEECEKRCISPTALARALVTACCPTTGEGDTDSQPGSPCIQEVHREERDPTPELGGRAKGTKRPATQAMRCDPGPSQKRPHKEATSGKVPTNDPPDMQADGAQTP